MKSFKKEKELVRKYFADMENASPEQLKDVMRKYMSQDYNFKGVYPFREQEGIDNAADTFFVPLKEALAAMQRRQDIFIGGENELDGSTWIMSMGHFMGLFDRDWLGIPHTRKMISLRYAEFNCVENNKIVKTGLFVDIIGFMQQAGVNPMPPQTGNYYVYPGPRNHNGLLFDDVPEEEGRKTLALVNKMVEDLDELNRSGAMGCPPEVLEKSWSKDMIWFGPGGDWSILYDSQIPGTTSVAF